MSESFLSLIYGSEEDTAKRFYPLGALPASLKENHIAPHLTWQTLLFVSTRSQIFSGASFRGRTNWYRCRHGQGLGIQKEKEDKLDSQIPCRALFIEQSHKSVVRMESVSKPIELFATDLITKEVDTTSHWVQFEAKDQVNGFLEEFLRGG
ncbi:hypothetical protein BPAE_0057g00450 [Botrytis paeoniae]|uniref:AB hydrolase-1 domain-containing protein n=1 Tax=Botrytis paeoniae TaxID=278948 RepID=A0A4Z1FUH0_9HELO|nr:hypothetical protein BPAE_0057g00450 [Botrytis paeoniae]